jgi:hypothetical protein
MRISAVALVLLLAQEAPPRDPVHDGLEYLLIHQGLDGSWGARPARCFCAQTTDARLDGDLEATAWAILAFSGLGFTELSKDDWEGRNPGLAMKAAMAWLLSRQDKDGAFDRKDVSANSVAALALLEYHGMTVLHKEAARKAVDWVRGCKPADDLARTRLGMALKSAELSDFLPAGSAELRELAASLEAGNGETARIGGLLIRNFAETARERVRGKIDYGTFETARLSPELLNDLTNATHGGKEWPEWYAGVRKLLAALQHQKEGSFEAGSWDGATLRERLSSTAIRCLTAEHYRCFVCRSNVFRQ